ncbi:MAG: hypothetical protein LN408_03355 [Candidatus Thermoplasmatota archaeon]|nr:hypothetical protein [Candidatus Thermoplasmatota archaeon]
MNTNIRKYGGSWYLRIPMDIIKKHKIKDSKVIDVHENTWDEILKNG